MPITNCRNRRDINIRQEIVNLYNLTAVAHIQLLPNQTKKNCCGPKLENTYYVFSYVHKRNLNDKGHFNVGVSCANDFLTLINQLPISPFNILTVEAEQIIYPHIIQNNRPDVNKQLENAINLFIAYTDITPYPYLLNILNYLRTSTNLTNNSSIETVNKVIGDFKQTIPDIINSLNNQYSNIRNFNFEELDNHIIQNNILVNAQSNNLT